MKKIIFALALACFALPARAQSVGEYWAREAARVGPVVKQSLTTPGAPMRLSGAIPQMIASAAARTGKAHFAATLVRIAKIESGLRCSPGGNGGGMFQFIRGTRRSLGLSNPLNCSANINAAMRYADRCIAMGARTGAHLMRCWNGGSPHARRLERAYRIALR